MRVWVVTGFAGKKNPYLQFLVKALKETGMDVSLLVNLRSLFPLLSFAYRHGRPDVVHIQWHHPFFVSAKMPFFLIAVALTLHFYIQFFILRWLGARFVWTVHNITHHEAHQAWWELWHCRLLARLVDRLIVHCATAVPMVSQAYRITEERLRVVPLGNYGEGFDACQSKLESRRVLQLSSSAKILLFFGAIRPYKGVEQLLDTFTEVEDNQARLIIVGSPKTKRLALTLQGKADQDMRIRLNLDFIADNMLVHYLCAADLVVLPYTDVLTSSAVNLAAALGKCCIIPRLSCLKDYPDETAIFYSPENEDSLKAAIRYGLAMTPEARTQIGRQAQEFVQQFPWSAVGRQTAAVYAER